MRFKNNIGPQVRRLREARCWSQSNFAVKLQIIGLDLGRGSVSRIENRTVFVDDRRLLYLAEALGVPVQDLFPPKQKEGRFHEFMERLARTRF